MIRPIAFLKWCGGLALLASVLAFGSVPASADSFGFSYRSGPVYHHPYYHPHYYHPHSYWGPHYGASVVFVQPPVVYAPPPVVYAPQTALNAYPASEPYRTSDGRYCREYQANVVVNGIPQSSYGTACLQPDGSWRVVN